MAVKDVIPERTMDQCADAGPNSPRSPRQRGWDTRRARYGEAGHAGYRSRPQRLRTPLEAAALRLIVRPHLEEVLSEGQCCQALTLDRVEFREFVERFHGGNSLGERIYAARQDAGLTQQQLSVAVGVGRPQIANIEAGRCDVPVARLVQIAAALGVSAGVLLPAAPVEASPRQVVKQPGEEL